MVSVHSRGTFLENGGDVAQNLLCGWTLFLPMGRRFSIDALRESLAVRRERAAGELDDRAGWRALAARPVISLAVLAILLQVSVIYYFNAVHKHGWTWREGKAIHYVLYQERMVTWFGLLVRPYVTLLASRIMTYATLVIEVAAPALILNPVKRYRTRSIAILLYPALHVAFASFLNLGQFSFNMMGYFPLMLVAADWQLINRLVAPPQDRAPFVSSFLRAGASLVTARRLRSAHVWLPIRGWDRPRRRARRDRQKHALGRRESENEHPHHRPFGHRRMRASAGLRSARGVVSPHRRGGRLFRSRRSFHRAPRGDHRGHVDPRRLGPGSRRRGHRHG
jgi:hypothetical protein